MDKRWTAAETKITYVADDAGIKCDGSDQEGARHDCRQKRNRKRKRTDAVFQMRVLEEENISRNRLAELVIMVW